MSALTRLLEIDVQRRIDLEPFGFQFFAVAVGELSLDEIDEVRRLRSERAPRNRLERRWRRE